MKPTTDDAMSRSASYRETYRRHRVLCWVPVVLGALVAALVLFLSSTSYKSTASLWVDTGASVTSSIGANGSPSLDEPPAESEQAILAELLTTDSFADAVVRGSLLGSRYGARATTGNEAQRLLGSVQTSAPGGQILNLSYTATSRAVAQSVLSSVVTQLQAYNNNLASSHAQASASYDSQQVTLDQGLVARTSAAVKAFERSHPNANKSNPTYVSLTDAEANAIAALGQATTTLNQATPTASENGWIIRVLDAAGPAVSQAPHKKKIVAVVLGGAFGGLLVALLAIIALTPARREQEREEGREKHQDLFSLLGSIASNDSDSAQQSDGGAVTGPHDDRPAKVADAPRPAGDWFADVSAAGDRPLDDAPADPFVGEPVDDSSSWETVPAGPRRRQSTTATDRPRRSTPESDRPRRSPAAGSRPRTTKKAAAKPTKPR